MRRPFLLLLLLPFLAPLAGCDSGDPTPDEIRRVYITEVEITSLDFFNPNSSDGDWDSDFGGGPDVYFDLVNDITGAIYESTQGNEHANVRQADLPIVWSSSPSGDERDIAEYDFGTGDFDTDLAFDLWDEDPQLTKGDDDFMGFTDAFRIRDILDVGAPNTYRIDSADGLISVRIRLRYTR